MTEIIQATNGQSAVGLVEAPTDPEPGGTTGTRAAGADEIAEFGSDPALDLVLARYLDEARAERRATRDVEAMSRRLESLEKRRAIRKGRKRVREMKSSAVFQGVLGMASSALSAVGAGLGGASGGSTGSASKASSGSKASSAAGGCDVGAGVLDALGAFDFYQVDAERYGNQADAARSRAEDHGAFAQLSAEHAASVRDVERRALEIMDRVASSQDAAARIALTRRA